MINRRLVRGGRWRASLRLRKREIQQGRTPSSWRTVTFSYDLDYVRAMLSRPAPPEASH